MNQANFLIHVMNPVRKFTTKEKVQDAEWSQAIKWSSGKLSWTDQVEQSDDHSVEKVQNLQQSKASVWDNFDIAKISKARLKIEF